eukprot:4668603-Heterocapsa_arctica.AAC.1
MVLDTEEAPLPMVAARSAWWSLDMASLKEVAGHLQLPILVSLDGGREGVQELLEVDEAAKVLAFEDEKVLKKEQEAGKERQNNHHTFAEEYVAKKKAVRAAAQA